MLSVRIVTTDHYMAPPVRGLDVCYSEFRGREIKQVPVMRIYGSTPAGQKSCMHVHGIFPYLYVPYDGSEPVARYLRQVATSIDKAVNIAQGRANATSQHVYKISLVSALPFYGYHEHEQQFLKIYLYNPHMVKKVADLVLGGAIMNKVFQPHESHIPYNLQAFIDYNLYGMNMVNVAAARFRQPDGGLPSDVVLGRDAPANLSRSRLQVSDDSINSSPLDIVWNLNTIPSDSWMQGDVERQSSCELELDVVAADIINRLEIGANVGANPGLVALWDDERQRRRDHDEDSHLSPPQSPDRGDVPWTAAETELQDRLSEILRDLQPYISDESSSSSSQTSQRSQSSLPPASQIQTHHSFTQDSSFTSSQDTVILGSPEGDDPASPGVGEERGGEGEEPVVSETSIHLVVSRSQSFHGSLPTSGSAQNILNDTQDRQMLDLLADLAAGDQDDNDVISHVTDQVTTLEEADSILSQVSNPRSSQGASGGGEGGRGEEEEGVDEDEKELLELSQSVWDEDFPEETMGQNQPAQTQGDENISLSQLGIDLAGMDQSWNSSQWENVGRRERQLSPEDDDDDVDLLPQYDGPADDKTENQSSSKKRLGMLGPSLIPSSKSKGIFSITAKKSSDTVVNFTSSSTPHPLPPPSTSTSRILSDRVSPLDASRQFFLDLRSPGGLVEVLDSENSKSGKNSPKEGSRASDVVDLKTGPKPPKASTTRARRSRAGRHDNIFASLASELPLPPVSAPTKPPTDPEPKSSSSSPTKTVDFQAFIKKSRAKLSSTGSGGELSPLKITKSVKESDGRKSSRMNRKSEDAEIIAVDTESDGEEEKPPRPDLVPRRRSSDSSSDGDTATRRVTRTRKTPTAFNRIHRTSKITDVTASEPALSEMSEDQVSLRVDPDSDTEPPMFDLTGCDDPLDIIVDLPPDPTSVSDSEQEIQDVVPRGGRGSRIRGGSRGRGNRSSYSNNSRPPALYHPRLDHVPRLNHSPDHYSPPLDHHHTHHHTPLSPNTFSLGRPSGVNPPPSSSAPKSCVSLAERKRKLSLKKIEKQREKAERRNSLTNPSDSDSHTSNDLFSSDSSLPTPRPPTLDHRHPPLPSTSESLFETQSPRPQTLETGSEKRLFKHHGLKPHFKPSRGGRRTGRGWRVSPQLTSGQKYTDDQTVWVSVSNLVNYYNGRKVSVQGRKTRHMAEENMSRVKILKEDCHNYKLTEIGQEKLYLHNMVAREVSDYGNYNPKCDKRFRHYQADVSLVKRCHSRPPGWKRHRNSQSRESESSIGSLKDSPSQKMDTGVSVEGIKEREGDVGKKGLSLGEVMEESSVGKSNSSNQSKHVTSLQQSQSKHAPSLQQSYSKHALQQSQSKHASSLQQPQSKQSLQQSQSKHPASLQQSQSKHSQSLQQSQSKHPQSLQQSQSKHPQSLQQSQSKHPQSLQQSQSKHPQSLQQSNSSQNPKSQSGSSASLIRHSSLDHQHQQQSEKGDVSVVVDFSVLENPMDNDLEGLLSADSADPHRQLHTPPLLMDVDAGDASSQHSGSSPRNSDASTPNQPQPRNKPKNIDHDQMSSSDDNDDGQQTVDDTLTETDLYSDSNIGQESPNEDELSEDSSRGKMTALKPLKKQDSVSTEASSVSEGRSKEKSLTKKVKTGSLKLKIKKINSGSSSEAVSHGTEDDERMPIKKRRKYEQNESYKNRSKRATVDYTSDFYARKTTERSNLKDETTPSYMEPTRGVGPRGRGRKGDGTRRRRSGEKPKPKDAIHYVIVNKFRGFKSMRVLLERLQLKKNQSINWKNVARYKKPVKTKGQLRSKTKESVGGFECRPRTIVSDVPHENQTDPLWEAQMQRLGGESRGARYSSGDEDSSPDETSEEYHIQRPSGSSPGKVTKKQRVPSYHKRLSNAFCGKTRRPKRKTDQNKIWNTLSLLHNATVAQLTTSPNTTYDDGVEDDHDSEYVDVMYKLALYSPPESEHGGESPPQPMSPAVSLEEYEALVQEQDDGPRTAHAHIKPPNTIPQNNSNTVMASTSKDDSQMDKIHLKNLHKSSAMVDSPTGSDPDLFGRQGLMSEYNSTGMNANSTGSPYTVKEAIVRFNPAKVFGSSHKGSPRYSKDITTPDLGPPTLPHMSPPSLGSNSGSPPELAQHEASTSLDAYASFFGTASMSKEDKSSKKKDIPKESPQKGRERSSSKGRGRKDSVEKTTSSSSNSAKKSSPKGGRPRKISHRSGEMGTERSKSIGEASIVKPAKTDSSSVKPAKTDSSSVKTQSTNQSSTLKNQKSKSSTVQTQKTGESSRMKAKNTVETSPVQPQKTSETSPAKTGETNIVKTQNTDKVRSSSTKKRVAISTDEKTGSNASHSKNSGSHSQSSQSKKDDAQKKPRRSLSLRKSSEKSSEKSESKEKSHSEKSRSKEKTHSEKSGSKEKTRSEKSGSKEKSHTEKSGSKEKTHSGSKEKSHSEKSGSKEKSYSEKSGIKEKSHTEKSGNSEVKKDKSTHSQKSVQSSDKKAEKKVDICHDKKRKGTEEISEIRDKELVQDQASGLVRDRKGQLEEKNEENEEEREKKEREKNAEEKEKNEESMEESSEEEEEEEDTCVRMQSPPQSPKPEAASEPSHPSPQNSPTDKRKEITSDEESGSEMSSKKARRQMSSPVRSPSPIQSPIQSPLLFTSTEQNIPLVPTMSPPHPSYTSDEHLNILQSPTTASNRPLFPHKISHSAEKSFSGPDGSASPPRTISPTDDIERQMNDAVETAVGSLEAEVEKAAAELQSNDRNLKGEKDLGMSGFEKSAPVKSSTPTRDGNATPNKKLIDMSSDVLFSTPEAPSKPTRKQQDESVDLFSDISMGKVTEPVKTDKGRQDIDGSEEEGSDEEEESEEEMERCERLSSPIRSPSPARAYPSVPCLIEENHPDNEHGRKNELNESEISKSDIFASSMNNTTETEENEREKPTDKRQKDAKDTSTEHFFEESKRQKVKDISSDLFSPTEQTDMKETEEESEGESEEEGETEEESEGESEPTTPIRSPSPPPIQSPTPTDEDIRERYKPSEIPMSVIGSPRAEAPPTFSKLHSTEPSAITETESRKKITKVDGTTPTSKTVSAGASSPKKSIKARYTEAQQNLEQGFKGPGIQTNQEPRNSKGLLGNVASLSLFSPSTAVHRGGSAVPPTCTTVPPPPTLPPPSAAPFQSLNLFTSTLPTQHPPPSPISTGNLAQKLPEMSSQESDVTSQKTNETQKLYSSTVEESSQEGNDVAEELYSKSTLKSKPLFDSTKSFIVTEGSTDNVSDSVKLSGDSDKTLESQKFERISVKHSEAEDSGEDETDGSELPEHVECSSPIRSPSPLPDTPDVDIGLTHGGFGLGNIRPPPTKSSPTEIRTQSDQPQATSEPLKSGETFSTQRFISETIPETRRSESAISGTVLGTRRSESAISETIPRTRRSESAVSETIPDTRRSASAVSETISDTRRSESAVSETILGTRRSASVVSETIPDTRRSESAVSETILGTRRSESAISQTIPETMRSESAVSETIPETGKSASAVSETILTTSRSAVSETIPGTRRSESETIPETRRSASAVSETIPETGRSASFVSETILETRRPGSENREVKLSDKSSKENSALSGDDSDNSDDSSDSDDSDGRISPVSLRSPAVSIRSPSPIRSLDDIAEPDDVIDDDIKSPSPVHSPDDVTVSCSESQPAMIPLTIDTSVGDPRVRRTLLHSLPSPNTSHPSPRPSKPSPSSPTHHTHPPNDAEPHQPPSKQAPHRRQPTRSTDGHRPPSTPTDSRVTAGESGTVTRLAGGSDSELTARGTSVIMPTRPPPSRHHVGRTSDHHHDGGAFYSDPKDAAQQRPREVGGRVLKVNTNKVSELAEVEGSLSLTGLHLWQETYIADKLGTDTAPGQSQDFNILDEMRKDAKLKGSLLGNQAVILKPTHPPPPHSKVELWAKAKKLYQKLRYQGEKAGNSNQTGLPNKETRSKLSEEKSEKEGSTPPPDLESLGEEGALKGKGKAGKGGKVKNPGFSRLKTETKVEDLDESGGEVDAFKTPCKRTLHRSHSVDESIEDDSPGGSPAEGLLTEPNIKSPPLKRRRSLDDTLLPHHSTPHTVSHTPRRRVSFLQSQAPPCTPIRTDFSPIPATPTTGRRGQASQATPTARSSTPPPTKSPLTHPPLRRRSMTPPPAFTLSPPIRLSDSPADQSPTSSVTKPRPLRRISGATQSFLRRVLLSSQKKNPFETQLSVQSNLSQIEGATPKNTYGFKVSLQNIKDAKTLHEFSNLTTLSIEVLALGRGDLLPDPQCDQIVAVFYSIINDVAPGKGDRNVNGAIVLDPTSARLEAQGPGGGDGGTAGPSTGKAPQRLLDKAGTGQGLDLKYVMNEEELVNTFIALVKKWDPDILVGWEIQSNSWGYLMRRSDQLNINLCQKISRITTGNQNSGHAAEKDEYGSDFTSEIHVAGRIVINLWRILRHEVTLNIYTFENVMYHVMHRRVPKYSSCTLSSWWQHRTHLHRWRAVDYFVTRAEGCLQIMSQIDLIGQTSEFARVFGIEFFHVLSRGSQYRVESMMLRIAKPMNLVALSPSVQQRARQAAPECIPLTLEPESRLYTEPMVVLDFQSLYPSIMIAYNYCYSTCLGRLDKLQRAHEGPFEFGCSNLQIPPSLLKKLRKHVNICPNGVVFARQHIKKGIISRMVEEILKTRLMVKRSMKEYKGDRTLERLLHSRQLGLKLIANVTFGYTAANYSGRMPCVEIGDSIVRKARETLERAIELVERTEKWSARVVYGDTDSLFISLPGRSKDEAFHIGQEIADHVTADNPKPVKLKFEKVYLPCVLQTKKRYVGYMYETPDQKEPVFDAKGIETVRRDSCSAVSKILERSLKVLFNTKDLSLVKQYVQKQFQKLLEGRADIQDFIFAKEYRGMAGYKPAATVPALEIAKQRLCRDRQSEPKVGERVPYVIVYGTPGLPLIQLVREPHALVADPALRLNANYYITKAILPPLDRAFRLMGVDVFTWYDEMPRIHKAVPQSHYTAQQKKGTISQYFSTMNCPVCEELTTRGVCEACTADPQLLTATLNTRIQTWERTYSRLSQVCTSCMETADPSLPCRSLDCPVLFRMVRAQRDLTETSTLREILSKTLSF